MAAVLQMQAEPARRRSFTEGSIVEDGYDATFSRRLMAPAARGDATAVERLLQRRAHPDLERPEDGVTPLAAAAQAGHVQVVRVFCENGVDANKATRSGWSPLHLGVHAGHAEVARLLCAHGANKECALPGAGTPLHVAAGAGHINVVKVLCEAGADKDSLLGAGGRSPLHLASAGGHVEVIQYLVESGADQYKVASNGVTPSFEAVRNGHRDLALSLGGRARGFTL